MKILYVGAEVVPFVSTGGLGDVLGSLPAAIAKNPENDVRVILPKYTCMKDEWKEKMTFKTNFYMDYNWRSRYVGIFETVLDGITIYFIDNEEYFGGETAYTSNAIWDIERFAFYEEAKKVYCIISTGEKALYANIMLQKGVVVND